MAKKKPHPQQIYAAINRRDISAVRQLLSQGADPNGRICDSYHGSSPVILDAAGAQFLEGVLALLEAGADPNLQMTGGAGAPGGATALHAAIYGSSPGPISSAGQSEQIRSKIVDLLLAFGANPNVVAQGDMLPLTEAARGGYLTICERLIEHGATFKTWPPGCNPPLFGAAIGVARSSVSEGEKQERVAKRLIELGAPVDGQTAEGMTALMAAALMGSERLVEMFIAHQANVNHRSTDGRTPFICAAEYAQNTFDDEERKLAIRIFDRLLEAGADPRSRNSEGKSAYQIASRFRQSLAAEFLKQFE